MNNETLDGVDQSKWLYVVTIVILVLTIGIELFSCRVCLQAQKDLNEAYHAMNARDKS